MHSTDNRQLYRFTFDCGRQGTLEGVFFADPDKVARAIGRGVHFGEALGKHSEIYGTLDAEEVTLLDVGEDLAVLRRHAGLITSGYDPLEYVKCRECGGADPSTLDDETGLCRWCREE